MRPLHLSAIVATVLLVWSGVSWLQRPPARPAGAPKKAMPTRAALAPCTIKPAIFGGAEAALLKVMKDQIAHYVILDLTTDDPRMPEHQSSWLKANYGAAEPSIIGIFPTVEAAVEKAAGLCWSN